MYRIITTEGAELGLADSVLFIKKITDATLKTALMGAIDTVTSVVKEVYQTYVEALKDKNAFTAECQKEALASAIEKATALIPEATQTCLFQPISETLKRGSQRRLKASSTH